MNYKRLGKTGLMVSEIGLGGEWLERRNQEECKAVIAACQDKGINILDCWMSEPNVRTNIGIGLKGSREQWIIQGHLGSTWQGGQYVRTRDVPQVEDAFNDLLTRLQTDYIDLGMIHYVDTEKEFREIMESPFIEYVRDLKRRGVIRHIGMSTHNPRTARLAAESGEIEMLLFSVNPAFDLLPPSENLEDCFAETYADGLSGIDPERSALYRLCEQNDVGITVMKGFAGGRLFKAEASPFGVALSPVQCIHYALTRPAVASVMCGMETTEQVEDCVKYETASDAEKDYATPLAGAPRHAFAGQCTYCGHCKPCPADIDIAMVNKLYDLATMQPEVPASVAAHYKALDRNADDCVSCGGCETRCPFSVRVVERMEAARKLFNN